MDKIGKTIALFLTLTIIVPCLTLLTINFVNAQTMSKPSVPEFTLELEDNWLKVTAQNQPIISNGHDGAGIFYDARFKWRESDWPPSETNSKQGQFIREIDTSGTTNWMISINGFYELLGTSSSNQLDYQIRAINGYPNSGSMYSSPFGGVDPNSRPIIIIDASDWSNTQTITIPDNFISANSTSATSSSPPAITPTVMPTSIPTTTDTNSDSITLPFSIFTAIVIVAIVALFASVLSILVLMRHLKTPN
jgi:hypothetical protein